MAKLNEDGNTTAFIIAIAMLISCAVTIFTILPTITPSITSQFGEMPVDAGNASDALTKAKLDVTAAFETMATAMKITLLAMVAMTIIYMWRWVWMPYNSNTDYEETPSPTSTPPQTVVSNTPHATIYVAGVGGAGGSGGGNTPYYYPVPNTSPVKYEQPKPKKPIVDRDGVEDDDSSFIEVLD
jgi:hypothetical protein